MTGTSPSSSARLCNPVRGQEDGRGSRQRGWQSPYPDRTPPARPERRRPGQRPQLVRSPHVPPSRAPFSPRPPLPTTAVQAEQTLPSTPQRTGWGSTSRHGGTPGQRAAGAWPPAQPRGWPGAPSGTGDRCMPWGRCSAAGTAAGRRVWEGGNRVSRACNPPRHAPTSCHPARKHAPSTPRERVRPTAAPRTKLHITQHTWVM